MEINDGHPNKRCFVVPLGHLRWWPKYKKSEICGCGVVPSLLDASLHLAEHVGALAGVGFTQTGGI